MGPCIGIWAGLGISAIASRRDRAPARQSEASGSDPAPRTVRPVLAMVLSAAMIGGVMWIEHSYGIEFSPERISRERYGLEPFWEADQIGRYLRAHTTERDTIAIIGSEPEIYFYARRPAATKFLYTYPLVEPQPHALEMQREMIREIEAADPAFLIYVDVASSWMPHEGSPTEIFRWLEKTVAERYEQAGIADVHSLTRTEIHWGPSAAAYQPKSLNLVFIFARKRTE
jgi:hypothetical protein